MEDERIKQNTSHHRVAARLPPDVKRFGSAKRLKPKKNKK